MVYFRYNQKNIKKEVVINYKYEIVNICLISLND